MPSWWIDKPILLGTSNPTTEDLREWYAAGFRTVISLLEEAIQKPYYDVEIVKAMGYTRYNIPLMDFSVPKPDQYPAFVKMVGDALKRGPVVMHCMAGQGRTGAMAAAYWIAKGLTAQQALEKVKQANPLVIENSAIQASLYEFEKANRR